MERFLPAYVVDSVHSQGTWLTVEEGRKLLKYLQDNGPFENPVFWTGIGLFGESLTFNVPYIVAVRWVDANSVQGGLDHRIAWSEMQRQALPPEWTP